MNRLNALFNTFYCRLLAGKQVSAGYDGIMVQYLWNSIYGEKFFLKKKLLCVSSETRNHRRIPCYSIIRNWMLSEKQGRDLRNDKEKSLPSLMLKFVTFVDKTTQ